MAALITATITLIAGCAASAPSDAGGEPSDSSEQHARDAAAQGLEQHDRTRFLSAVGRQQRSAAVKAWTLCEPALAPHPSVMVDDAVVPEIVGIIVRPHDKGSAGCWVVLEWKKHVGWSMHATVTPSRQKTRTGN